MEELYVVHKNGEFLNPFYKFTPDATEAKGFSKEQADTLAKDYTAEVHPLRTGKAIS